MEGEIQCSGSILVSEEVVPINVFNEVRVTLLSFNELLVVLLGMCLMLSTMIWLKPLRIILIVLGVQGVLGKLE